MLRFLKNLFSKNKPSNQSEVPYKVETPTVIIDDNYSLQVVREAQPAPSTPVVAAPAQETGKMAAPKLTKVDGGKTPAKKAKPKATKTPAPKPKKDPKKPKASVKRKTEK